MSERGTFVTSYLYDYPNLAEVLRQNLPWLCRNGCPLVEHRFDGVDSEEKARVFSGLMHAGYPGEEAYQAETFVFDVLVPALPAEHGEFSIAVLPEYQEYATVFTVKDREVTILPLKREIK